MAKAYKRKQYIESDSRDSKGANDLRKHFNKTERQRGKSEAVSQLIELEEVKEDMQRHRWNLEIEQASKCSRDEFYGPETMLAKVLRKLGVGDFYLYKCTCENLDTLSNDEVLNRLGF